MKIISVIFGLVLTLGVCNIASAAGSSGAHSISHFKLGDDRLTIYAEGSGFTDKSRCSRNGTNRAKAVAIPSSRVDFKELYAAVMLAHANDRKVQFWLDGACTSASAGGPFPTAVVIYVY